MRLYRVRVGLAINEAIAKLTSFGVHCDRVAAVGALWWYRCKWLNQTTAVALGSCAKRCSRDKTSIDQWLLVLDVVDGCLALSAPLSWRVSTGDRTRYATRRDTGSLVQCAMRRILIRCAAISLKLRWSVTCKDLPTYRHPINAH